jgi:hypothetical protein
VEDSKKGIYGELPRGGYRYVAFLITIVNGSRNGCRYHSDQVFAEEKEEYKPSKRRILRI